jgi:hypothetical protein
MTQSTCTARGRGLGRLTFLLGPLVFLGLVPAAWAQFTPGVMPQVDLTRAPIVPPEVVFGSPALANTQVQPNRIRLLGFQPGFLSDPPGLDQDEPRAPDNDGPDFFSVAFGNDNPLFDFRLPGDPGGVGFTRVNTQLQLFDTSRTACSLGLQAVTPAGLQFDGLPDRLGPTVLTPALSIFHALDDATAVQAFVGKNLPIQNSNTQSIRRDLRYGLAVQRPLSLETNDPLRNLYLSVGVLGLARIDSDSRNPFTWEMLPGLHYKMADNWWISTGVGVPFSTASRLEPGQHWRLTCSLQF